jgi:hypothetical protein
MAIANGNYSFNTGRDGSIVLRGPYGRVNIPLVTSFDSKAEYAQISSEPLTGQTLSAALPKGWSGSIGMDRGSADVDRLFAQMEAAWLNNGAYVASDLFHAITESNGSTTTFHYTSVSLTLEEAGSFKGDAIVSQKIGFRANSRVIV